MLLRFINIALLLLTAAASKAQTCTTLGQTPNTAFPVCGTSVFTQSTVPLCADRDVPSPCPRGPYEARNPFWYKFTCYGSGSLAFTITPLAANEDYDWQLFDITGRNANEVFTNSSLLVASNWTAEFGATGASSSGSDLILCDGPGVPLFTAMPTLIAGHDYLLLISHFTNTQSGYNLSFGGGSAIITDPLDPHLKDAVTNCNGKEVTITLNKQMKCSSLAADGSDFKLNTTLATIVSAVTTECTTGFETETVTLTFSNPLPPGNYTVSSKKGRDGNTLLDLCERGIPENEAVPITIVPIVPTLMDSLVKPTCAPGKLVLVFSKSIACSSIDASGSDFRITGSYSPTILSATANCENGFTKIISVNLSQPMFTGGSFRIELVGNLTDECGGVTPLTFLPFTLKDTVSADFNYNIKQGCQLDTVNYSHNGAHGVNQWQWTFDTDRLSSIRNPEIYYSIPGIKSTSLSVTNGFCTASVTKQIVIADRANADFEVAEFVCPNENLTVRNLSTGVVNSWFWTFPNGNSSTIKNPPPQTLPVPLNSYQAPVKLIIKTSGGCIDSLTKTITVLNNCRIEVPSAFTPNNDGLNDFLYPLNAYKAKNISFSVFNRFGQRVFFSNNYFKKWDGILNGKPADAGTYVWYLSYIDNDTQKKVFKKGTVILIR